MFERLIGRARVLAGARRKAVIGRLLETPLPKGVGIEAGADGVVLSGKGLRRRLIADLTLRTFGR